MPNYVIIKNEIKKFTNKIRVASDKSISIRCVLLASQAIGTSKIYNLLESEDVINSLLAIKKLGINYKKFKNFYEIMDMVLMGSAQKKIRELMLETQVHYLD